jgi:hypothetical protein
LLLQVPLNVLGLLVIWRTITFPQPKPDKDSCHSEEDGSTSKVNQIDFLGATSLGLANTFLLLFLDRMQSRFGAWRDAFTLAAAGAWVAFAMTFVLVEAYWARQPILPLRLMVRRNVLSSYLVQFFQTAAQMAVGLSTTDRYRLAERTRIALYVGPPLLPHKSRRFQLYCVNSSANHHFGDHAGWAYKWMDHQVVRLRWLSTLA